MHKRSVRDVSNAIADGTERAGGERTASSVSTENGRLVTHKNVTQIITLQHTAEPGTDLRAAEANGHRRGWCSGGSIGLQYTLAR